MINLDEVFMVDLEVRDPKAIGVVSLCITSTIGVQVAYTGKEAEILRRYWTRGSTGLAVGVPGVGHVLDLNDPPSLVDPTRDQERIDEQFRVIAHAR